MTDAVLKPWTEEQFTKLWMSFVERHHERDLRMDLIRRVIIGDWGMVDAEDNDIKSRSPNLVHVGLYDTAASAAMVPTVRVPPTDPSDDRSQDQASKMEQLGASYLEAAGGQGFFHQESIIAGAYGFCAAVAKRDRECGPHPEYRDAVGVYPEFDVGALGVTSRVVIARSVYVSQLPEEYQVRFFSDCLERGYGEGLEELLGMFANHSVTLVEYYATDRTTIGLAYNTGALPRIEVEPRAGTAGWVSAIVDDDPNPTGRCLAVIGQLPSIDGEPRGQYDQVVGVMEAHIRLTNVALEYADQAVYNPMFVVDPISEINDGPEGWIELGPAGKIGRVPPATVPFSFFEEMNRVLDSVHIGSRWPRQRTGEIDQSQESGKHFEGTLGVQNTVIGSHHEMFQRMMTQLVDVCFALDAVEGPTRVVSGINRNNYFHFEHTRDDIDPKAKARVEYGLAFGRDVAQGAVLAIQLMGAGIISLEDAQENFPGITDVLRTQSRILSEMLEKQIGAKIFMGVQANSISDRELIEMLRDARQGKRIEEIFEKVVEAAEKKAEEMLTSGLPGVGELMPGPQPAGELGPAPPPAPDPASILGMLGGGGAEAPSTINRLSVPLGEGSFAGSQVAG